MTDDKHDGIGGYFRMSVVALGALFWVWFLWQLSADQTRGEIENQYATRDYAERTEESISNFCMTLPDADKTDCIEKAIESRRKEQRNERDLNAQETMARWTWVMGGIAGIGLIVSLIGIGLIYVTFKETRRAADTGREANEIARSSSERQLRAYVGVERIFVKTKAVGQVTVGEVVVKNFGQTPAYNYHLASHLVIWETGGDEHLLNVPSQPNMRTSDLQPSASSLAYPRAPNILTQEILDRLNAGTSVIYLVGRIDYEDTFGNPRVTRFRVRNDNQCKGSETHLCDEGNCST